MTNYEKFKELAEQNDKKTLENCYVIDPDIDTENLPQKPTIGFITRFCVNSRLKGKNNCTENIDSSCEKHWNKQYKESVK